jgi:hypothetical protein
MDTTEVLTFEPWADPAIDTFDCHPESPYSRLGWLPIIGPSSWLVWGTLAAQLRRDPQVSWPLTTLAEAHGLQRGNGRHGMMRRTLARLCQFHLLADAGDDRYLVRLSTPPLSRRQLERLPAYVAELHQSTFARNPGRQAG